MIRYTDLDYKKLIALTDEDVQIFIDIEVAYAGIIPVAKPKVPEYHDVEIKKTETFYEVGNLLFKNRIDAENIVALKVYETGYNYRNGGYDYKFPKVRILTVNTIMLYKEADIIEVGEMLQENKEMKEGYQKIHTEYNKYMDSIKDIKDQVWEIVRTAKNKEYLLNEARKNFQKYMELANNDREIAETFFKNAYGETEITLAAIGEEDEI
jgi:hypothetical protein